MLCVPIVFKKVNIFQNKILFQNKFLFLFCPPLKYFSLLILLSEQIVRK
jgi:hypothetical protein